MRIVKYRKDKTKRRLTGAPDRKDSEIVEFIRTRRPQKIVACRTRSGAQCVLESQQAPIQGVMNSNLEKLIDLQQIDSRILALRAEIAALPKHVAVIEAKLAGSKAKVEAAQTALKADETVRRKHESDIQDQQQKISKYKDQSLNVKTNQEYKALMEEIQFAEKKISASEDKILEIMIASDTRKAALKEAEAVLRADTSENDKEKEAAKLRTAEDEKELAELTEKRKQTRSLIDADVLRHYDRVFKLRGSALSAVHEDQMCSGCRVLLRPQVFQDVMTNEKFVTCDSCQRILYFVSPSPGPEETKEGKAETAVVDAGDDPAQPSPSDAAVQ